MTIERFIIYQFDGTVTWAIQGMGGAVIDSRTLTYAEMQDEDGVSFVID